MKIVSIEFEESENSIFVETEKYSYRLNYELNIKEIWRNSKFEEMYYAGSEYLDPFVSKNFTKEIHKETCKEINAIREIIGFIRERW